MQAKSWPHLKKTISEIVRNSSSSFQSGARLIRLDKRAEQPFNQILNSKFSLELMLT